MRHRAPSRPRRFPCHTVDDTGQYILGLMRKYAGICGDVPAWHVRGGAMCLKDRYEYAMALARVLQANRGRMPHWYFATVCREEWQGCTADAGVDAAGIQARIRAMLPEGLMGWWTIEVQACTNAHASGLGYITLPHAHGILWTGEPLRVERIMARTNRADGAGVRTLDLQEIGSDGAVMGNLLYCAAYSTKPPHSLKSLSYAPEGHVVASREDAHACYGDIYADLSRMLGHHRLSEMCWGIGDDPVIDAMRAHFGKERL